MVMLWEVLDVFYGTSHRTYLFVSFSVSNETETILNGASAFISASGIH
jgi:hypothetical protein